MPAKNYLAMLHHFDAQWLLVLSLYANNQLTMRLSLIIMMANVVNDSFLKVCISVLIVSRYPGAMSHEKPIGPKVV